VHSRTHGPPIPSLEQTRGSWRICRLTTPRRRYVPEPYRPAKSPGLRWRVPGQGYAWLEGALPVVGRYLCRRAVMFSLHVVGDTKLEVHSPPTWFPSSEHVFSSKGCCKKRLVSLDLYGKQSICLRQGPRNNRIAYLISHLQQISGFAASKCEANMKLTCSR
jgi:hypothetical protein